MSCIHLISMAGTDPASFSFPKPFTTTTHLMTPCRTLTHPFPSFVLVLHRGLQPRRSRTLPTTPKPPPGPTPASLLRFPPSPLFCPVRTRRARGPAPRPLRAAPRALHAGSSAGMNLVVLLRMGVAMLCGAIIGLERRAAAATAGVRTLVLVSLGSAIFTLTAVLALPGGDPTRIAASIAAGVGFIGSGTINATESTNRGLTTAASIWIAAALGVGAAHGLLGSALVAALVTVAILRWSRWERYVRRVIWRYTTVRRRAIKRRALRTLRQQRAANGPMAVKAEVQEEELAVGTSNARSVQPQRFNEEYGNHAGR